MFFSVKHYIYLIRCKTTNRQYIGSSSGFPAHRWAEHWSNLRNKHHINKRFQQEWDAHPSLVEWEFSTLEVIDKRIDRRILQQIEAGYIIALPESLRLNMPCRTTVSLEKHEHVEKLLRAGMRYCDIRDKVGISVGMISKIKKRMTHEFRQKETQ